LLNGLLRKNPAERISASEAERLLLRAAGPRARTIPGRAMIPAARMKRPPHASTLAGAAQVGLTPNPPTEKSTVDNTRVEENKDDFVPVVPDPRTPSEIAEVQQAAPADVPDDGKRKQRTWWWAAAAVGVVLAAILVVAAAIASNGDPEGKTSGTAPSERPGGAGAAVTSAGATNAAASPTPGVASPTAAGEPVLPSGWRYYEDPTGFRVAVPQGWVLSRRGTMVYFREPNGGRVLGIDQTDQPKSNPVADWRAQEVRRVRAGDWADYQQVKIVAVDYFIKAADWEFTYASDDGRIHVINRGFITSPHQAYGIYWSTPDSQWNANLDNFRLITQTFKPRS
jgi:eukaryotic-like serine/threonine-protein kinase